MLKFILDEPEISFNERAEIIPAGDYPQIVSGGFSVNQIPVEPFKGFKSAHRFEFSWHYKLSSPQQNEVFLDAQISTACLLLYKHDPAVYQKMLCMIQTAYYWATALLVRETNVALPEFEPNQEKLRELEELLLMSDSD